MNVSLFITLLTGFSAVTGLITQFVKNILDECGKKYVSNLLATIIACIVGVCGTGIYYVFYSIEFTPINITCMILMGLATSVGAMTGYDKIVQTLEQFGQLRNK